MTAMMWRGVARHNRVHGSHRVDVTLHSVTPCSSVDDAAARRDSARDSRCHCRGGWCQCCVAATTAHPTVLANSRHKREEHAVPTDPRCLLALRSRFHVKHVRAHSAHSAVIVHLALTLKVPAWKHGLKHLHFRNNFLAHRTR
jgi:hypothetical protein